MTWETRAECSDCDDAPHVREVQLERVATASNGVTIVEVRCADCGRVIEEQLGYDSGAVRASVSDFSWITGEDVMTRDDVR